MRNLRLGVVVCLLLIPLASAAQQLPQRDPQAIALLRRAFLVLGGNLPTDSVATGTIEIVAGSRTERGTIRILTRGFDQTVEQIDTAETQKSVVYSKGVATEFDHGVAKDLPLELAVTSQSHDFPLTLIALALNDPKVGFSYVGLEAVNGIPAHHIRLWTAPPRAGMEHLTEFSAKHLWIAQATGIPIKLAYARRPALGPVPAIPLEIYYSDYRTTGGVFYPFRIDKSYNGTPWATTTINSVDTNRGLTNADFPVARRGTR